MSGRPFRHLCPEADERDAMTDGEFWERVAQNLGVNTEHFEDFDGPSLDVVIAVEPCAVCGSAGACGYDAEGRPLIHADANPDGDPA